MVSVYYQSRPTPADGDAPRVDHKEQVSSRGESAPTAANGATADAAAGPSAAETNNSMTTTEMAVVANNDEVPRATGIIHATGNVTAPPAKSSAARTDRPSPSASSGEEEWHSASSRLRRTPHSDCGSASSSASSSSSFYATPGTTGTDGTTTEAIVKTNSNGDGRANEQEYTGRIPPIDSNRTTAQQTELHPLAYGLNNSAGGDLLSSASTSSSDKIADARKKLQWTPPPTADNKWARLGLPIDNPRDGPTATTAGTAKGRSRSNSFDAGSSGSAQHHPSTKKTKTSKGASPASSSGPSLSSSMRIPKKNKKIPKKQVLLGNLQRSLDRALASPRDMYGSPDDLNVVEEKAGIIGISSTAVVATAKTNDAGAVDATESTKADDNGDVVSSPANLLTLPDSHTKDVTFPPSCPVLVYDHAAASVLAGRVASVCIDISPGSDRSFLYCIKPDFALSGVPSKITVAESKIRFAPGCPVVVTLNGSSSNGMVGLTYEVDEGHGHVTMYTVHLLNVNGGPDTSPRDGITPQELKFRPTSDVEVMGVLTDPSNRALSSLKKDESANSTIASFGQDETKYFEKGEIADDMENRMAIKTFEYGVYKQSQGGLCNSTNTTIKCEEDGSILGGSTRSQGSSGSFSFDIKTSPNTNDVAIAVGIANGLDLDKVREKLYGADKSTNERMEKALEVKVTIVGRDFDYPDPSVQFEDGWDFDGPYVLVRGTRKCVRKAVKVVSHILCDAAFDGTDKDRLKKDIAAASVQCAIVSSESTEVHGNYADRHYTGTSGEASFYSSMHDNAEFPSQFNGSNYDFTYRINFPSWMNSSLVVGRIVGKKGQHVKKLCERFHCNIDTFGASTARPREHPDDEDELPYLVCIISGPNREQIDECRLHIESIAMKSTEPEWRGRFAYDLAVSTEVGYSDHYCYFNNPRDGSIIVPAVWPHPGDGSQKYMTCIDITSGVVEAPEETIGDLEELGHHYYCVIHLWGSVEEPHLHIVADSYEDAQAVANEIYRRLTGTSRNNGTEEGIVE